MARVTVEDCVTVVPNRFELCLIANDRARSILSGAATTLSREEKTPVIALREIADNLIAVDAVRKNIVRRIKNSGALSYDDLISQNATSEVVDEDIEDQNLVLKDNIFLEDNITVDD